MVGEPYIKSLKIRKEVLGTNHPNTKIIKENLEIFLKSKKPKRNKYNSITRFFGF